jgi:hypothetical protein
VIVRHKWTDSYKEIDNTYEGSDERSVQSLIEVDRYIDRCIDSQDRGCDIVIANKERERNTKRAEEREKPSCLACLRVYQKLKNVMQLSFSGATGSQATQQGNTNPLLLRLEQDLEQRTRRTVAASLRAASLRVTY